jgi:hypothetical protein
MSKSLIVNSKSLGKKLDLKKSFHLKSNDVFNLSAVPLIDINAIKTGKKRLPSKLPCNFVGSSLRFIESDKPNLSTNHKHNLNQITKRDEDISTTINTDSTKTFVNNFNSNEKKQSFQLINVESIHFPGNTVTNKSSTKSKSLDYDNKIKLNLKDSVFFAKKNSKNENSKSNIMLNPSLNLNNRIEVEEPMSTKTVTKNNNEPETTINKPNIKLSPKFKLNKIPVIRKTNVSKIRNENGVNLFNNLSKDYTLLEKTFRNKQLYSLYDNNNNEQTNKGLTSSRFNQSPNCIPNSNKWNSYDFNNRFNTISQEQPNVS